MTCVGCTDYRDKKMIEGIWAIDKMTFIPHQKGIDTNLTSNLIVFDDTGSCRIPAFFWQEEAKSELNKAQQTDKETPL